MFETLLCFLLCFINYLTQIVPFFFFVRSSHQEVFCKKGVLRNFEKLTRKHLCGSLFFDKVAGLRPATLLKKRLWHRCFPVNFVRFLRTPFLTEDLRWLLLIFLNVSLLLPMRYLHLCFIQKFFFCFNFVFRRSFLQKKKKKKKIFIENHKKYGKS